jgi:hypothetical protein
MYLESGAKVNTEPPAGLNSVLLISGRLGRQFPFEGVLHFQNVAFLVDSFAVAVGLASFQFYGLLAD